MVRTRRLIISLALLPWALLALADNNTEAESNTAKWADLFQHSEWVLRVHIEGVGQLVNPAMSRNHLVAVQGYRYSASVMQSWKGEYDGTVRFQVALNDCSKILQVDGEYIVFGSSNFQGALQSDSCEKIIAVEEADSLLPQLEKFLASG